MLLDGDDVAQLGQTNGRLRCQVHARAAGNVVEHDRQRRRLGDRLEVLVEPFLGRLVVVRRDREQPVGSDTFHVAGELDRLPRVVSTGSGEHRHFALRFPEHELHHTQLLAMRQRRRFPRRPARRQEVNARVDLSASQTLDRRLIEGTVMSERRNKRGANTCKWGTHGHLRTAGLKTRRYEPSTAYFVSTSCMLNQPVRP